MSSPKQRYFGGTYRYAWLIPVAAAAVFALAFYVRWQSAPRPTELERLIAQNEPDEHVHALWGMPDGNVYVATHLGLIAGKQGTNWARVPGAEGDVLAVQPTGNGQIYLAGRSIGVSLFADGKAQQLLRGEITALAAESDHLVAYRAVQGLQESRDGGKSWTHLSAMQGVTVQSLALQGQVVAAGGLNGEVMVSRDGGRTWRAAVSLRETVSSLLFDPSEPGRLWAAAGGFVLYTDDLGETWKRAPRAAGERMVVGLGRSEDGRSIMGITSEGFFFRQTP